MKFNLFDIVVIAIFIFFIYRGYKKGFVKTATVLIAFIAALTFANFFGNNVGAYLKDSVKLNEIVTNIAEEHANDALEKSLERNGYYKIPEGMEDKASLSLLDTEGIIDEIDESLGSIKILADIKEDLKIAVNENITKPLGEAVREIRISLIESITTKIFNSIGFILVFLITLIIVRIIGFGIITFIEIIGPIKTIDSILGIFAGLLSALFLIGFLLITGEMFSIIKPEISESIYNSYSYGLFIKLLANIFTV